MNFHDKVIETAADFRARASAFADTALATVRARAAGRVDGLKTSLAALQLAGRELNKVARIHVTRFVKENSVIARDAGKDVTALARSTYSKLAQGETRTTRKPRKSTAARKRSVSRKVKAA